MKRGNVNGGVFLWNDTDPNESLGPGLSRPEPGERTRLWSLEVKVRHQRAMRVQLPAATIDAAIRYAERRWPESIITIAP